MTYVVTVLAVWVLLLYGEALIARWRDQKIHKRIDELERKS